MIYGREYGAGSSDCPTCEAHSSTLQIGKCEYCEKPGCDKCLVEHHGLQACAECAALVDPNGTDFRGMSTFGAPAYADEQPEAIIQRRRDARR